MVRVLWLMIVTICLFSFSAHAGCDNADADADADDRDNTDNTAEKICPFKDYYGVYTNDEIIDGMNAMQSMNLINNQDHTMDSGQSSGNQSIQLFVFVSSSMPKQLLKSYVEEAAKYGAVLVFKGLPNGSFKELMKLVMELQDGNSQVPMQIDDEAFARFGVEQVPTFVLSRGDSSAGGTGSNTYDKATGSIYIQNALEKFASDGDLSNEARKWLDTH